MCRVLLLGILLGTTIAATRPPHGGITAAASLAQRVLGPRAADLFEFHQLPDSVCEPIGPCATVDTGLRAGTVRIGGTTPVEMAYGLAQYCARVLLMSFTWERSGGFQISGLPASLPPLTRPWTLQKRCAPGQGVHGCYTHYMNGNSCWMPTLARP